MEKYLARTRTRSQSVPRSPSAAERSHKMAEDSTERMHEEGDKNTLEVEALQSAHGTVIDYTQLAKPVADIIRLMIQE